MGIIADFRRLCTEQVPRAYLGEKIARKDATNYEDHEVKVELIWSDRCLRTPQRRVAFLLKPKRRPPITAF